MATASTRSDRFTERELASWRGMLRTHAAIRQVLSRELEDVAGLSLSEYEVLLHLHDHPDGRMAMTELADSVLLTPSGITRLVDRLVSRGWVERQACPTDARRQHAVLTTAGRAQFVVAGREHLRGVRQHFLSSVTDQEQEVLARVWARILAAEAASDNAPSSCGPTSCGPAD